MCSAGWMLRRELSLPSGPVPTGASSPYQRRERRDCATNPGLGAACLARCAPQGGQRGCGPWRAGRHRGLCCAPGKGAVGSRDSGRTLHWHLPALPARGHSAPAERGQHEAPHFIKPCAMSETGDAIFPLLHSFLWCFSSHNLLACPYPAWNTNLTNVQSDCCDANKFITSSGVKFHS